MGWADYAIKSLGEGQTVEIRPKGNSMLPIIQSGQLVQIEPFTTQKLKKEDIVLVKVRGNVYLHLIKAVSDKRFLIGNNRGGINGWVGSTAIYGIVIKIGE